SPVLVSIRRDDGARLVAHRGKRGSSVTFEGVKKIRVTVAHHAIDMVNMSGEGGSNVSRNSGHRKNPEDNKVTRPYVSRSPRGRLRAPFSSTGAKRPDPGNYTATGVTWRSEEHTSE